ncbi:MAG: tRNA (N6-isopentenyl adenosine(37)-C2)-methylthiotransferase MiaB [Verrucomicrobia bacterium GWF2_62_7]|nr:MAG: tRNA (N6-isopentenyl adenosine(37)-C2)-methylthiotransferase MiaB [Verrucomicrobia bacterium GWF2_62_7]
MKKVFIKTYGCQMNERDSDAVAAMLRDRGYALAESERDADVILLNTCSVRDLAEQKALGKMGLLTRMKHRRSDLVLGFMGCMAQRLGPQLFDRLPKVDLVVGTQKLHRIPDHLDRFHASGRQPISDIADEPGSENAIRDHVAPAARATAFVSIMQGCDMQCSFCIVPTTRGAERSRSIEEILAEVRALVAHGVKEVTLLGQIVTSYGRGVIPVGDGKSPFVQLLEAVNAGPGLERIRFSSAHPQGFRDDLIRCYGRLEKLCEYVHLPVQSGSDRILKAMCRTYSADKYRRIIEKLRARVPGIALSTDIIVGFPGETDADFATTVKLCEEMEYDNVFLFKYSNRSGTPAAAMPGQIPQEEIVRRHHHLWKLTETHAARRNAQLVGRRVQVLVEGEPESKKVEGRLFGRTRCNRLVYFPGAGRQRGQLLDVHITRAKSHTLYGELCHPTTDH